MLNIESSIFNQSANEEIEGKVVCVCYHERSKDFSQSRYVYAGVMKLIMKSGVFCCLARERGGIENSRERGGRSRALIDERNRR